MLSVVTGASSAWATNPSSSWQGCEKGESNTKTLTQDLCDLTELDCSVIGCWGTKGHIAVVFWPGNIILRIAGPKDSVLVFSAR